MGTTYLHVVFAHEGDIFRASNDYKVYIAKYVGAKKFKRWFVGPQMFDIYKHLSFAVVKVVDPSVAASFTESKLVRVDGDDKVWHIGNAIAGQSAEKQWVPTLAAFQAGGFDWDGVYIINSAEGAWYVMGANYGGATGPTPTTPAGGTIGASLATDNPAGAVLPASSAFNPMLKVTLTGGPASVTGLTLTKYGFVGNTNVTGVSVWDQNGVRHGNIATSLTNDNKVTIGFGSNPIVMNGAAQTITVAVNLGPSASSGTLYWGIASASDITSNGSVGGAFPLMGNLYTLTSAANVAAAKVDAQSPAGIASSSATANVDVGDLQKEIAKFKFTENSGNEDMQLESLTLYVEGDITESKDVLNWKLYDPANNVLATTEKPVDRYVTFKLATPYVIAEGQQKTLSVKADFKDGANRWVRLQVQNDYDVMVRGVSSRIVVLPTDDGTGTDGSAETDTDATTFTPQVGDDGYFKMRQGAVTVNKASNAPSGQVSVGATDALLGKFTLRAQGEDMEVRKMDVYVTKSLAETALTGNISVRDEAGTTTYMTISSATGTTIYTDSTTRFDLSTYIQLTSNVDKVISIYGNISSNATANDAYSVEIGRFYVKRLSSIDFVETASTMTAGNTLNVVATDATVAKNTAMGSVTVPPGAAGVKIGSFVVQSGTAEDSRVSNVTLTFGAYTATSIQNLALKVNGVQQGSTISTPTDSGNSFSVSINAPKSTPVIVDVFADVKSEAGVGANPDTMQASVGAAGVTLIGLQTSQSITRAVGATALQTVTFGEGSLTVTKDSSSPTEQILTPANGTLQGIWKFEAKNEDLTLRKVTFTVREANGLAGTTVASNFGALTLKDGSTVLATGSLVGTDVVFSGFNVVIPASASKSLSLYADLTGSGTQAPGTIASWTVKSDTTPTDIDVTGTNGQLAVTAINGAAAETLFATSTRFLFHNSKPVMGAATNTPSGSASGKTGDSLFVFTVGNTGTRDMRLGSLAITVNISGGHANGSVNTWELYDGSTKIAETASSVGVTSNSVKHTFDTGNDVSSAFDNFTISAGATKTLTLKANTAAIKSGMSSGQYVTLSAQIVGTTGYASGSTWNTGDVSYYYTPTYGTEQGPYTASDSYPVNGGTLTY